MSLFPNVCLGKECSKQASLMLFETKLVYRQGHPGQLCCSCYCIEILMRHTVHTPDIRRFIALLN